MKDSDKYYIISIEDNIPVKEKYPFLNVYPTSYNALVSEFFFDPFVHNNKGGYPMEYIVHLKSKSFTEFHPTNGYTLISQSLYSDGL